MKPAARWAVAVAAPMTAGLYVRGFCALLDIPWGDGMQTAACLVAIGVTAGAVGWAGGA